MRYWLRVVIIGAWSLVALAQSVPPRIMLELGPVTVWLGMPRQEVINKCASAGFKSVEAPNGVRFLNGDNMYTVEFKNDRLSYADREWYFANRELDAFQSTIAALGAIADDNSSVSCTISHEPLSTPEMQINRVFIFCGNRSYLLIDGKMNNKKVYGVTERIGKVK
jgi:hypothetical protein